MNKNSHVERKEKPRNEEHQEVSINLTTRNVTKNLQKILPPEPKNPPFVPRPTAICSDQYPRPPPAKSDIYKANTAVTNTIPKIQKLGGNSPPSQSERRSKLNMASSASDW